MVSVPPTSDTEHRLLADGAVRVAGMDEVGRGALAGPVTVGVAVMDADVGLAPSRLRDSKLLRPAVRTELVPELREWAVSLTTGSATPQEIDALGIIGALRLAGCRALAAIAPEAWPDVVLLDGVHDWLTTPDTDLLSGLPGDTALTAGAAPVWDGPIRTIVKGDLTCASIAAASVVAKVERDDVMAQLAAKHPAYGWERNKGYGSAQHRDALVRLGASEQHRRSWNLGVPTR